jgi:hypothetical protein
MARNAPSTKSTRTQHRAAVVAPPHPRATPFIATDVDAAPDQPFAEGMTNDVDPDLRHRMVSEAAYRRYAERGYEDGYDQDDWLQAEADVDHLLLGREPGLTRDSAT